MPQSGALKPLPWSPFAFPGVPYRIALNPKRSLAYVVSRGSLWTFDIAGGNFRPVATEPASRFEASGSGLLLDPAAQRLYISDDNRGIIALSVLDPRTGVPRIPTFVTSAGSEPRSMVVDSRHRFLYVTNISKPGAIRGFRIDARTGYLIALRASPFRGAESPDTMMITPDDRYLYATNFRSNFVSGFAIDPATGSLLPMRGSPFTAGDGLQGIVSCRRAGDRCVSRVGTLP
jgi:6-phosphogluconolactonase (cycloisomerase 2 family)